MIIGVGRLTFGKSRLTKEKREMIRNLLYKKCFSYEVMYDHN